MELYNRTENETGAFFFFTFLCWVVREGGGRGFRTYVEAEAVVSLFAQRIRERIAVAAAAPSLLSPNSRLMETLMTVVTVQIARNRNTRRRRGRRRMKRRRRRSWRRSPFWPPKLLTKTPFSGQPTNSSPSASNKSVTNMPTPPLLFSPLPCISRFLWPIEVQGVYQKSTHPLLRLALLALDFYFVSSNATSIYETQQTLIDD